MSTSNTKKITLEPIPGFPEFPLNYTIVMCQIKLEIIKIYEQYGFIPFDTRLVETDKVLNQKGIDTKELYILNQLCKGVEKIQEEFLKGQTQADKTS